MVFRKIVTALAFLTVSVCYADASVCYPDSLMTVKTNSLPLSDSFKAYIENNLSQALNKRCSTPERISALIQNELYSIGYVATPEDAAFSVQYIFDKKLSGNQLITSDAWSPTVKVFSSYHDQIDCGAGLGVKEKDYLSMSQRKLSRFVSAFNRELNGYELGSGLFFILVQPSSQFPGKKNIFHCDALYSKRR
ncbi:hypothetical protein [Endozoicomonas sp. 4G]|uniref:hypothetical protein n=1 Tax=Endozoicomonas sp. 4G TaxID=2872754 RepID=UPI0020786A42|nr:hypothetical protein [Endozoicomonas sp. 4G]